MTANNHVRAMKTLKDVKVWAKSVNLVYRKTFAHHYLKTRTSIGTVLCSGGIAFQFIDNANDLRRWHESRTESEESTDAVQA